jgi:hypothetical protein
MHEPSTVESQILETGMHLSHMNIMVVPIMALKVPITTQTTTFDQPRQSLSSVVANESLLNVAARTEKKPAKAAMKGIFGEYAGFMSYQFLP